jgi:hypothetical protein
MPAMTIRNMIENGATHVRVVCGCRREASVDVSGWNPEIEIPDIRLRMRCTVCGERPQRTIPDWPVRHGFG